MSLHYDSIEQLPEHLRKQAKEKLGIITQHTEIHGGHEVNVLTFTPVKQNREIKSPLYIN